MLKFTKFDRFVINASNNFINSHYFLQIKNLQSFLSICLNSKTTSGFVITFDTTYYKNLNIHGHC